LGVAEADEAAVEIVSVPWLVIVEPPEAKFKPVAVSVETLG
jgi:hypothetical protein